MIHAGGQEEIRVCRFLEDGSGSVVGSMVVGGRVTCPHLDLKFFDAKIRPDLPRVAQQIRTSGRARDFG